jgi:hypothetical protein
MGQPARAGEQARRLHLRHLLLHLRLVRHSLLLTEGRQLLRGPDAGHRPVLHWERLCRRLPRPRRQLLEADQAVAPPQRRLPRAC